MKNLGREIELLEDELKKLQNKILQFIMKKNDKLQNLVSKSGERNEKA